VLSAQPRHHRSTLNGKRFDTWHSPAQALRRTYASRWVRALDRCVLSALSTSSPPLNAKRSALPLCRSYGPGGASAVVQDVSFRTCLPEANSLTTSHGVRFFYTLHPLTSHRPGAGASPNRIVRPANSGQTPHASRPCARAYRCILLPGHYALLYFL
jgi:hypothetical protein